MWRLPHEGGAFAGKVDKWPGNGRIILDPDAHVASDAKEHADIGKVLAVGPVVDLVDLGVIGDVAFIIALVPENGNFRHSDKRLHHGDGGSGAQETVEDAVDIANLLPNEAADLRVSKDGLVPTTLDFVVHRQAFDAYVIHEGHCRVGDLGLENEDNFAVEYHHGIGPSLWQTC